MKYLGIVVILLVLTGCPYRLLTIQDETVPQRQGHALSMQEVKAAILRSKGAPRVFYYMEDVEPGLIRCELNFKTEHKAWVDIPYTAERYSILYKDSENLRYQPPSKPDPDNISGYADKLETISGHYNNWIQALNASIQQELRNQHQLRKIPSDPEVAGDAQDRLRKLETLRGSNLISEKEFQAQRARILNGL